MSLSRYDDFASLGYRNKPKTFAFDHCFYSLDPETENFASQEIVFDALGRDILDNAFQGYNACIFAYGQTGTSRSITSGLPLSFAVVQSKGVAERKRDSAHDAARLIARARKRNAADNAISRSVRSPRSSKAK